MTTKSLLLGAVVCLLTACANTPAPDGRAPGAPGALGSGSFMMMEAGRTAGMSIEGTAALYASFEEIRVVLEIQSGLRPEMRYPAYVQAVSCADGPGEHYRLDETQPEGEEANEVWPTVRADMEGGGYGVATVAANLRPNARSVVVTDANTGYALACADFDHDTRGGSFESLPGADTMLSGLDGSAYAFIGRDRSFVLVKVGGLVDPGPITAHVHEEPCETGGGAHYLIDRSGREGEDNEVWPTVRTRGVGYTYGYAVVEHALRADAASVVLHDPFNGDKAYCADLDVAIPREPPPRDPGMPPPDPMRPPPPGPDGALNLTYGTFELLQAGREAGSTIAGTATLYAGPFETRVKVEITGGLTPGREYPAHLHNRSCAQDGGPHYQIDVRVSGAYEENEIWPSVVARPDGSGIGDVTVEHNVKADAQSVVIHDPETGDKLACADLDFYAYGGSFETLGNPTVLDGLYGTTYSLVGNDTTFLVVRIYGVDAPGPLTVHVHDAPCRAGAGGHYLRDPLMPPDETNEVWPTIEQERGRYRFGFAAIPHALRDEAQSVVIHDPMTGDKAYCADFAALDRDRSVR